jgi:uncharacterized OB-fold protein
MTDRAIAPNLFVGSGEQVALLGSACKSCGAIAFPVTRSCARCASTQVEMIELPRRGRLWTWTVQRFMPKPPYRSSETELTFAPFGLGYVELPGALRVESRLLENDPAKLSIGAEMELVLYTHRVDPDGTRILNYAFKPVRTPS